MRQPSFPLPGEDQRQISEFRDDGAGLSLTRIRAFRIRGRRDVIKMQAGNSGLALQVGLRKRMPRGPGRRRPGRALDEAGNVGP